MLSEASSDNSASSESDSETDSDSSTSSSSSASSSSSSSSSATSLTDSSDNVDTPSSQKYVGKSTTSGSMVGNTSTSMTSSSTTTTTTTTTNRSVDHKPLTSTLSQESSPDDQVPSVQTSKVKCKEVFSDDHNESSLDVAPERKRIKANTTDLKEMMDNYPDVYGIRRSSRCRKEPERFAPVQVESDASDEGRKVRKVRNKRKKDSYWDEDSEESASNESDEDSDAVVMSKHSKRRTRSTCARKVTTTGGTNTTNTTTTTSSTGAHHARNTRTTDRASRSNRKKSYNSDSSSDDAGDEDEDDSRTEEDDDEDERIRRSTRKKVSYKEQSDHTDIDDLVEVDYADYNAEQEEEGETIERVLETRVGKIGATGHPTTCFNVEVNGDPNAGSEHVSDAQKERQYLIKWKGRSHMHNSWESEQTLKDEHVKGLKKIENFLRKEDDLLLWRRQASPEDVEYFDCQEEMAYQLRVTHCNVERIISHQRVQGDDETENMEYLCKFEGLPYSECTWEAEDLIVSKFKKKVDEYHCRNKSQKIPCRNSRVLRHRPKFVQLKQQPDYIGGRDHFKLRDYQLDGLNWLAHSWCKENSVILADEMGLGKTIQTICFLNYLSECHGLYGPFLMVVPLSTMTAWQKEFEQWAPDLNFIVYIGDVNSRNMIRSYEWCHENSKKLKFNVLLTTYEILLKDRSFLGSVSWAVLGVDEAHRLKNDDSLLYKSLSEFDTNHRVLITGTPLQNSLRELWALLHFIMPEKFGTWEEFESEYSDCDTKGYSKLHRRLEPYLLRRVKKDVEKSLPAKVEQILRVEMTSIQKQYYKWILTKNFRALSKGMKGSYSGFANIMMELKKCCNHASLVRPTDEISNLPPLARIIRGAGKLVLLDKLLVRLKETGHRVLIFSQMVRMLDILSDYLTYRRFAFQRLDGSIKGELRKQALDHFNAENSQDFCFLLSTRAGGLGINLATADTVIIFDSDWNPQNDLQAQARAHRIGQKNQVNIYRLVTKSSVEEDIIERAKRKMVLDHLVIQRMDTTGRTVLSKSLGSSSSSNSNPFTKEELSQILKFGAEELFKEGDTGEEEPQVDIDEILKRAETREEPSSAPSDELLGAFKVASFNFNEDDVNAINTQPSKSQKEWTDIIPEVERQKLEEEEKKEVEFLPPRSSRKTTQQNSTNQSDSGEEYDPTGRDGSEDSDGETRAGRRRGRARKENGKDQLKGFSEQELRRFIKSYKKFASPMKRLDSIAMDAELQEKPMADLKHLAEIIQSGCENAIKQHEEGLSQENIANDGQVAKKRLRGLNFKLYGVTVFPRNILSCQQELEPLEQILPGTTEERKKWILDIKVKDVKDWDVIWTIEDDSRLLAGIYEYGVGSWESIKMDPSYGLAEKILPDGDQKPQAKQLQCRVDQLLKVIQKHVVSQKMMDEARKPRKRPLKHGTKTEVSTPEPISTNNENDANVAKSTKSSKQKKSKELVDEPGKSGKKSKENKKKSAEKDKTKDAKKKKKRKRDLNAPAMHFTANAEPTIIDGDLPPKVFEQCKEKMRPVKKSLKQLDNPDSQLSKVEQNEQFEACLLKIGRRIAECLSEISSPDMSKEWRNNLWTFVSKFTEYNPKKLYRFYKQIIRKQEEKDMSHVSSHMVNHSSNVSSTGNQVLGTSSVASRHQFSSNKYSVPTSSSGSSSRAHGYTSGFNKEYGFGDKRPNCSAHSPVKRSRTDEFGCAGRDRSEGNMRSDSSRNETSRCSDYNSSGARRPWHAQSSSNYDSQDRYRPYSNRPSHSNDKYHGDSRNRYNNRPMYAGASSGSGASTSQSSPFYSNAHPKTNTNTNHTNTFGSPLNSQRENRSSDWNSL